MHGNTKLKKTIRNVENMLILEPHCYSFGLTTPRPSFDQS